MFPQEIRMSARVLVADDHGALLAELHKMLQPEYFVVASASNGASLVRAAAAVSPGVIVIDVSMPGMSGLEAANILRREGSNAKIIFLSMFTDPAIVSAAFEAGASAYVFKNQIIPDLKTAMVAVLANKKFVSQRRSSGEKPTKASAA
jgi:DNA-binding NarL/FixJ family response regulator